MSEGSRFSKPATAGLIAIAITLVVAGAFALWSQQSLLTYQQQHTDQLQQAVDTHPDDSADAQRRLCVSAPRGRAEVCVVEFENSEAEALAARHDLQAQQDMARWAYGMFLASVGTFTLTLVGVGLLGWTLLATQQTLREAEQTTGLARDANRITAQIGEAQARAYVSITVRAAILLHTHPEGGRPHIVGKITNNGESQAKDLEVLVSMQIRNLVDRTAIGPRFEAASNTPILGRGEVDDNLRVPLKGFVLSDEQMNAVRSSSADVVFDVSWSYRDIFDKKQTIGPKLYWGRPTVRDQTNGYVMVICENPTFDAARFYASD